MKPIPDARTDYANACRSCALGLLNTARGVKQDNRPDEVSRLVTNARWYWRRYRMYVMENAS